MIVEVQTMEQRLASAAEALKSIQTGCLLTMLDEHAAEDQAKDMLVEAEGWIRCNCGCGAVKPDDGIVT